MTHPFMQFNRPDQDRAALMAEIQWEYRCVQYLLGAVGLKPVNKQAAALVHQHYQATGRAELTMQAFNEANPSFPLLLSCSAAAGHKLYLAKNALIPSLFNRFSAAQFVPYFEKWWEQVEGQANGRAIGLVFPRQGINGGMILHGEGIEGVFFRGFTGLDTGGTKKHPARLYLRAFRPLVAAIHNSGHGWTAD